MTYPNVMVLDYMKQVGQISPELQMQAEEFVTQGYQRLLSFEVPGGGFSLFGRAPADPLLTAYGLMMLGDMGRVVPIDRMPIQRTARWLMGQQEHDGSWTAGSSRPVTGVDVVEDRLQSTAFVVWALTEAGFGHDYHTRRGMSYLQDHLQEAQDPYVLALCANAPPAEGYEHGGADWVLDELAAQAIVEGDAVHWRTGTRTFMGGSGQAGTLEVTALAAQALLRAARHPDLAQGALTYLIQQKDSYGTWQTTQATVWALKALLLSAIEGDDPSATATVTVSLDGAPARPIVLDDQNAGVVHILSFDDLANGEHTISFHAEGSGRLMYQVTAEYYVPWEQVPPDAAKPEALDVEVRYDRTTLTVEDVVVAGVRLILNAPGTPEMVLVDLGLPPGFDVLTEDLQALVALDVIDRYELAGRQIIVYLTNLHSGEPLRFQYRLQARYPLRVQVPASHAYDYYNPDHRAEEPPVLLVVEQEEAGE